MCNPNFQLLENKSILNYNISVYVNDFFNWIFISFFAHSIIPSHLGSFDKTLTKFVSNFGNCNCKIVIAFYKNKIFVVFVLQVGRLIMYYTPKMVLPFAFFFNLITRPSKAGKDLWLDTYCRSSKVLSSLDV